MKMTYAPFFVTFSFEGNNSHLIEPLWLLKNSPVQFLQTKMWLHVFCLNQDTFSSISPLLFFFSFILLSSFCFGECSKTTGVFSSQSQWKTRLNFLDVVPLHSNWQQWTVLQHSWFQDIREHLENQSSFYYTLYSLITYKIKRKVSFSVGYQTALSQCVAAIYFHLWPLWFTANTSYFSVSSYLRCFT